jgi:glycosyltransferase involved in cell wall biosynthesis
MIELSVVIPVMNEEENIPPLLEAVHNAFNKF